MGRIVANIPNRACYGDSREQRMTTASNRGDAIDSIAQGMTPPPCYSIYLYNMNATTILTEVGN